MQIKSRDRAACLQAEDCGPCEFHSCRNIWKLVQILKVFESKKIEDTVRLEGRLTIMWQKTLNYESLMLHCSKF